MVTEEIAEVTKGYTVACAVRQENSSTDELAIFFHTSLSETDHLVSVVEKIRLQVVQTLGINPNYLIPVEKVMIPYLDDLLWWSKPNSLNSENYTYGEL
jgi:hypothetical protein